MTAFRSWSTVSIVATLTLVFIPPLAVNGRGPPRRRAPSDDRPRDPRRPSAQAYDINEAGQVVGYATPPLQAHASSGRTA